MADDLTDSIAENALAPRAAAADGTSAEQHAIPDQIAADRYAKEQASAKRRTLGIRFFNMRPPGAVS